MLHSANKGFAAAKRLPFVGSRYAFASSAAAAMSVSEDLKKLLKDPSLLKTESYIGGSWVGAADGDTVEVLNPATGEVIAQVSHCKGPETQAAIAEASSVAKSWAAKTGKERGIILRKWFDLVKQNKDDITTIMTVECGKPLAQSKGEFDSGINSLEWFAEEAKRIDGDLICSPASSKRYLVMRQPVGVVGAITPWNFPFSMITRKVPPALAAGCPVVLKPSELTPLTALALAELGDRAGIPRGVLNIVVGDAKSIGDELVKSDQVRKLAFTGSTRVGKLLMAGAANTVKKVSMELGGNAPFIVFEDADLQQAAEAATLSSYRNAGQTCICTNRVFVHESVHDAFVDALVESVRKLRLGSGLDSATSHGPLIQAGAVDKVHEKVEDALKKGATVPVGGKRPPFEAGHPLAGGNFYEPTVITDATIDMKVFREEIFGPVTPVFKFSTDEEVIQLANDTEYGLASYFFTKDLARAWKVAEALEFGMVGVNEVAFTSEVSPFGGIKQSGLGREESKYGLDEFMVMKTVCMGVGY